jgi:hypothetical protein
MDRRKAVGRPCSDEPAAGAQQDDRLAGPAGGAGRARIRSRSMEMATNSRPASAAEPPTSARNRFCQTSVL